MGRRTQNIRHANERNGVKSQKAKLSVLARVGAASLYAVTGVDTVKLAVVILTHGSKKVEVQRQRRRNDEG